ncbi:MAG: metallopeptidase family protein [Phycisphaerales bacterium]|nr:MAG: metallopeptidase family protein [Phycisphaerales bacterium]
MKGTGAMNHSERERFDRLLERVLEDLPRRLHDLLEMAPLIVEDHPAPKLLEELGMDPTFESLCGLHTGTPLTERTVEIGHEEPETIHLFRKGIIEEAGGWDEGEDAITEEIRVTLLHEIGHHFGLEEEDLEKLGYE